MCGSALHKDCGGVWESEFFLETSTAAALRRRAVAAAATAGRAAAVAQLGVARFGIEGEPGGARGVGGGRPPLSTAGAPRLRGIRYG